MTDLRIRPPDEPQRRPKREIEDSPVSSVRIRMPIEPPKYKKSKYKEAEDFFEKEGILEDIESLMVLGLDKYIPNLQPAIDTIEAMDIEEYPSVDIYGLNEEHGNIKDFLRDEVPYKGEIRAVNFVKDIPKRIYMERGKYMAGISEYALPKDKIDR